MNMAFIPKDSICIISFCNGSGANAYNTRDPSSGGNGIKLNIKIATLTAMKMTSTLYIMVPTAIPNACSNIEATVANTILVNGPASPIIAAPNSPYLTFQGLNGTGLAMKNGGNPSNSKTIGIIIDVARSRCFKGLSVSLPARCAVSSPSQCAA